MKQIALLLIFTSSLLILSCSPKESNPAADSLTGLWRGVIEIQDQELPFHFRISGENPDSLNLSLINGKEFLEAGLMQKRGDTLLMPMHIFDTQITAVLQPDGTLKGIWKKNYDEGLEFEFQAKKGDSFRFETSNEAPTINMSGRWEVILKGEQDTITTANAIGVFEQVKGGLTGTFLTPIGDYRYLEGNVAGNNFFLSAFDGEHAFLFKGKAISENKLEGTFWSSKSWKENFVATRNPQAKLPEPDSLTYLKKGYDKLEFSFPDLQGKLVSLRDPAYQNKVVIVQLFGSWCPNCMDETKFLADWYSRNKDKEVAIIGLAYEKKDDFEYARKRVQKMVDRLNVGYDFLIAGTSDKEQAATTLPMLNHVMAFPTTIFLDKAGNIRRIYTGFNGPGTGEDYVKFVEDFNLFTAKLLSEPAPSQKK